MVLGEPAEQIPVTSQPETSGARLKSDTERPATPVSDFSRTPALRPTLAGSGDAPRGLRVVEPSVGPRAVEAETAEHDVRPPVAGEHEVVPRAAENPVAPDPRNEVVGTRPHRRSDRHRRARPARRSHRDRRSRSGRGRPRGGQARWCRQSCSAEAVLARPAAAWRCRTKRLHLSSPRRGSSPRSGTHSATPA